LPKAAPVAVGAAVAILEAVEPRSICADRGCGKRAIEPVRGRDGAFLYLFISAFSNSHMKLELPFAQAGRMFV
jgi:hypothetical protein